MRIYFIGLLFFLIGSFSLFSQPVDITTAHTAAMNFSSSMDRPGAAAGFEPGIDHIDYLTHDNDTLIYLFHYTHGGFVFISADAIAYPVVGYGFGDAPVWERAHSSVKAWQDKNLDIIADGRRWGVKPHRDVAAAWALLLRGEYDTGAKGSSPLLPSIWNQDWPYNASSPQDDFGPGGRAYAGCVAVSMVQVMYYFRYPESGTGSHGYHHHKYGYQYANFGNAIYDYNSMVDDLDNRKNDQVATLMYDAAVAVNMNFSPNGSGASMNAVTPAMVNYFNFDNSAQRRNKNDYTLTQWKNMIIQEIDQKRPLIYAGYPQNFAAGHAFNLDGYQGTDHFHFNWGWGGSYDGYYYISSLTPGNSEFTYGQTAIFNLEPGPGYPPGCNSSSNNVLTGMRGTLEDGSGPWDYENNASCSWLIEPDSPTEFIELQFQRIDTEPGQDIIRVYDGTSAADSLLATLSGDTVPPVITSSGSTLYITFHTDQANTAQGFRAAYKAFPPVYCSGLTMVDSVGSGTITDGSGNDNYNNNTFCRWLIAPPGASYVTAHVTMLDTYDDNDFIAFYDPSTQPGTQLAMYHGNATPPPVTSPSGKMLVIFRTGPFNPAQGFELEFTSDVVSVEENPSGEPLLTVYPNPSPGTVNIIIPEETTYERLEVRSIEGKLIKRLTGKERELQLHLSPGVYVVFLSTPYERLTQKIIITGNER